MPSDIKFCDSEFEALAGLLPLAIVLYMTGLRRRMDFSTGLVGAKRPFISWQALRELGYVEPHSGLQHEYPSVSTVRRAAWWLEKAGLIEFRSIKRQLIFFLPLAVRDQSVQKQPDRGPTDKPDRVTAPRKPYKQTESGSYPHTTRQSKNAQPARHPVSGNSKPPSLPVPPPKNPLEEAGGKEGKKLVYPENMSSRQRAAMAFKLRGVCTDMGQAVLDELGAYTQAGEVRSFTRLSSNFAKQAKEGCFVPEKWLAICASKEAATRLNQARLETDRRIQTEAETATFQRSGRPENFSDIVGSMRKR